MAIVSKPVTINRGEEASFTLNIADLTSHTKVQNDAYFQSSTVWSTVSLLYKSDTRDQYEVVLFNVQESNIATFFVSQYSVGNFLIESLVINDFDGGKLTIPRDELTTSEFDVTI